MAPLLIVGAAALLLLAVSVAVLIWLQWKFGIADPPGPIEEIRRAIQSGPVHLDLAAFAPGVERGGRKTHTRSYATDDGVWRLTVETEAGVVVAFQAVLRHKKSWWLGRTVEGWHRYPKIIMPGE